MKVDLVLPVYNEEGNLRPIVEEIQAAMDGYEYRIIFVDDGSDEPTRRVLSGLASERDEIIVLHFDENRGQSAAFKAGFEFADAEFVVTLDSDRQNDPSDIPKLIEEIEGYDLVAGYREDREDNWLRTVGSQLANWVRNAVTGDDVIDTGCSLKVFRQEVIQEIPMFEGMHRFLPTLARMKGYQVKQVPTSHRPRVEGETKYTLSGRLLTTFWDLLAVRWMQDRNLEYSIESVEGDETE